MAACSLAGSNLKVVSDVPPLDDMSELIHQVNKLRQDVSHGDSTEQRTKTADTQPKKKSESSVKSSENQRTFGGFKKGFLANSKPRKGNPTTSSKPAKKDTDIPVIRPKNPERKVQKAVKSSIPWLENKDFPEKVIEVITCLFKKLVDAAVCGVCLPTAVLAVEALSAAGYHAEVVEGFQKINYQFVAWHCWIVVMGKPIDIGGAVTREVNRRVHGIIMPSSSLFTQLPKDCERVDMDTHEEVETLVKNIHMLRVYQQKGATEFWAQPGDTSGVKLKLLEIRSQILSLY